MYNYFQGHLLIMRGAVVVVFETPRGVNKEGQEYGGTHKVQIQGMQKLKNGQAKLVVFELNTDSPSFFESLAGRVVEVPVTPWFIDGRTGYTMPKGFKPVEFKGDDSRFDG